MIIKTFVATSVVALLTLGALAGGCFSDDTGDCGTVCSLADESCGETTCLAYCLQIQAACNETGSSSSFNDFAACTPVLSCSGGHYGVVGTPSCGVAQVELLSCGQSVPSIGPASSSSSKEGGDGGIVINLPDGATDDGPIDIDDDGSPPGDGGSDVSDDGGGEDGSFEGGGNDSGFDSGGFDSGGDDAGGDDAGGDDASCTPDCADDCPQCSEGGSGCDSCGEECC
jgi:hypothetical protein